jgi:hypothetical protein
MNKAGGCARNVVPIVRFPFQLLVSRCDATWHERTGDLLRARRRLEAAGVPSETIERHLRQGIEYFYRGGFEDFFKELRFRDSVSAKERLEALTKFLDAWGIQFSRKGSEELDETEKQEVEVGRQKLFLKEVARKYEKMVDRGAALDPVSFRDVQLEEASRCYLTASTGQASFSALRRWKLS